jgi:hypothetical protein
VLEVLLDCIGCLSTPPTGYLLDPAYRGMLSRRSGTLAAALQQVERAGAEEASSSAVGEVPRCCGGWAPERVHRADCRRTRPAPRTTTACRSSAPAER